MSVSPQRINQFLARRGIASRRAADELLAAGRVRVNGEVAHPGWRVDPEHDLVTVDSVTVRAADVARTFMLNKPVGPVSTHKDPQGRHTVFDMVSVPEGTVLVGRLDAASRGLMLMTTDGQLAHRLTHPRYGIQKRYRLGCAGSLPADCAQQLVGGVELDDGLARAVSAQVVERGVDYTVLVVVMGEGRKREVRRMCAALGIAVVDLQRTGIGPISLQDLPEGHMRELGSSEIEALYQCAGIALPANGSVQHE